MRALIMLVLVAGCGFGPNDEFTGRRVGDGIAPWAPVGPVQICLGNEFIGPPDSQPGGLCAASTLVEARCAADDDCDSREACVCGRCIIQYCTAASDCTAGRVCSFSEGRCDVVCSADDQCAEGEECFNGACRGRCFTDDDCQTGEVCNSANRCITARCSTDPDCLAGERCRVQRVPRVATEPSVLARRRAGEPRFTMWFELSEELQQDRRSIWRATSPDGVHFQVDPARPVLEDADAARAPSVVRADDGYYLYYQQGDAAAVRVAYSTDGVEFINPVTALTGGVGDDSVGAPSAVDAGDGRVVVYFERGGGRAIGWAEGEAGGPLTDRGAALAPADITIPESADPEAPFWVDVEALRSPFALVTTNAAGEPTLRLYFSAFGRESGDSVQFGEIVPIEPNYSIGYAAGSLEAPAVLTPWPYNPVLDRVSAFLDHRSELTPAVVQVSDADGSERDGFLIYYMDAEANTSTDPPLYNRLQVGGNGSFR
jgi:hypothetical protein